MYHAMETWCTLEMKLSNALRRHRVVFVGLGFPAALAINVLCDGQSTACVWLTAIAAEEAVRSNNTQLLVQMVKEGWFQEPIAKQMKSVGVMPPYSVDPPQAYLLSSSSWAQHFLLQLLVVMLKQGRCC